MQQIDVDVAIIGAGTAGMTAYRAAKKAGKKTVLIEGGVYGTTCARVGCMPSKLLIAAANSAHAAQNTAQFGVHTDGVRINGQQVMQRVRDERDRFVSFVLADIESFADEDKIFGQARFLDDQRVQVDEHTQITANSVIIATGSSPFAPDVLTNAGSRLIYNDEVFDWHDLPKSLLVVGAGVIGLELGLALKRLGVHVTVINRGRKIGGISDPKVLAAACEAITTELPILFDADVVATKQVGDQVQLSYQQQGQTHTITADYVLSAAGRRPNIKNLGLENTSAQLDQRGMPKFNAQNLHIENTSFFFAGDVNNLHPILHEAADDGYQAGLRAAQWPTAPTPIRRRAPMGVVFSEPQIMSVGQKYQDLDLDQVHIGQVSFANQGRSRIIAQNQGLLRVYADKHTQRFIGAEMVGPAAEHLAHLLAWCLQMECTIPQMLAMPFYHPVIEEGLRTALRSVGK